MAQWVKTTEGKRSDPSFREGSESWTSTGLQAGAPTASLGRATTEFTAADGKPVKVDVIAGADKVFQWAEATIEGDTIVVSHPEIREPKHVRYGWAWNPLVNLYNKEGLPAVTFRTDE